MEKCDKRPKKRWGKLMNGIKENDATRQGSPSRALRPIDHFIFNWDRRALDIKQDFEFVQLGLLKYALVPFVQKYARRVMS